MGTFLVKLIVASILIGVFAPLLGRLLMIIYALFTGTRDTYSVIRQIRHKKRAGEYTSKEAWKALIKWSIMPYSKLD